MPKLTLLVGPPNKKREILIDPSDLDTIQKHNWYFSDKGNNRIYVTRKPKSGTVYLHRLLLGAKPGEYVDHINGNTLDNRRSNLRIVTNQQNSTNQLGHLRRRKSKYKGVKRNSNCSTWSARITVRGQEIYLGSFRLENEAALAYNTAALNFFGEYSCLNALS